MEGRNELALALRRTREADVGIGVRITRIARITPIAIILLNTRVDALVDGMIVAVAVAVAVVAVVVVDVTRVVACHADSRC